jgi:hypothetical protein
MNCLRTGTWKPSDFYFFKLYGSIESNGYETHWRVAYDVKPTSDEELCERKVLGRYENAKRQTEDDVDGSEQWQWTWMLWRETQTWMMKQNPAIKKTLYNANDVRRWGELWSKNTQLWRVPKVAVLLFMYMNFVMESKVAIIHREIDVCSGSDNHPWEDVMKVQIIIHWKI